MSASWWYATFRADFPDDRREVNGQITVPGGRSILSAVVRSLVQAGVAAREPEQHSFYGWAAEYPCGRFTIRLLLQEVDPWLLILELRAPWLTSGASRKNALREQLLAVGNALAGLSRISQVRWMSKEEYESQHPKA